MEGINQYNEIAAVFIGRFFLGCLFFFQGYDAVFKVKVKNMVETYRYTFSNKGIPQFFTVCASWFTSCSALIGGIFLMAGLFEYYTLFILGINLIVSAIGFGINTPVWDTRFVFPRLVLIIFLLLVPSEWNSWSVDHFIFRNG